MLLAKLAFRNLGRNGRRTRITGLALALGAALCIAYYGLADGMNAELVHALTRFDLGHIQLHAPSWRRSHALLATLDAPGRTLAAVRAAPRVRAASARVYAAGLVGSGRRSSGVMLIGIDPAEERRVTEIAERLVVGRFLGAEPTPWPEPRALDAADRERDQALTERETEQAMSEIDALPAFGSEPSTPEALGAGGPTDADAAAESRRLQGLVAPRPERPLEALIGAGLGRLLGVGVGTTLYLSTQSLDGVAEGVELRVVGVFETGTAQYDRARLYLHLRDAQRLLHLGDRVHEIAALTSDPAHAAAVAARLRAEPALQGLDVRAWSELRPDLVRLLDLNRAGGALLALIVLFVASLGVVNTMLMSVLERTRELGVLKALGMAGEALFLMIVTETALLAGGGAVLGGVLGLGLDAYLVRHGIDLGALTRGVSFGGVGMQPVLHGAVTWGGLFAPMAILFGVCLLGALYPALRAARMQPAVGMRET